MDKTLSSLGLAYRARKVVLGEEVINRIDKVLLLFIASDISEKSRARFEKKCFYYDIPIIDRYKTEELSLALGKNNVRVIGIIDKGFKELLIKE